VRCRIQKREANDVNPNDYLADVRLRVQTHPATRIDALSPQTWKPTADSS
jgi:transposase